jgi:serine palmitoyltransferase
LPGSKKFIMSVDLVTVLPPIESTEFFYLVVLLVTLFGSLILVLEPEDKKRRGSSGGYAFCHFIDVLDSVDFDPSFLPPSPSHKSSTKDAKVMFPPEELDPSLFLKAHAYWGYILIVIRGMVKEQLWRVQTLLGDKEAAAHRGREKWSEGWVEFYTQHAYKRIEDCWQRPICSAPDDRLEVMLRSREGQSIFAPFRELRCTGETRECLNLASYNYLGFGGIDEACTPPVKECIVKTGFSAGSRAECGTLPIHRELEGEVAQFLKKEDALVFGNGFATNSEVLPVLFDKDGNGTGVLVLSDALNHRSIVEGVRLSGTTVRAFSHNCMVSLETELTRAVNEGQPGGGLPWRKIFVVVEGIYSMEGDFCRLREIVALKSKYGAYLYLDEAHSIGAVGPTGRGVADLFGVPTSDIDVMMGTFTKSFGSAGGYVASSKAVIDLLRKHAPGSVFASAMSPPCAAQALAALRLIDQPGGRGAEKLQRIQNNSNYFRTRLKEEGFHVLGDIDSPVVPIMLFHPEKISAFSRQCLEKGLAVVVVGYPATPVLLSRARFCVSASHTKEQLGHAVMTLKEVAQSVGVLYKAGMTAESFSEESTLSKEYHTWLRTAPLRADGTLDSSWKAEPIAQEEVDVSKQTLSTSCLEASHTPFNMSKDFRRLDPLGYAVNSSENVQQAALSAVESYGFGTCGPRGFYGTTALHLELEEAIAKFLDLEATIFYSFGGCTASSVIPALIRKGDLVVVDTNAHYGIKAGLRLCRGAVIQWTKLSDVASIDKALQEPLKDPSGRKFIIAEGLSQRTGEIAALQDLVNLKEKHNAFLVLDETLSFGTLGKHGRGLTEHCGVPSQKVDALIGSLEHAVPGMGGFCAGSAPLVKHQRLYGAGYCFSASAPASACAASTEAIREMQGERGMHRCEKLSSISKVLYQTLCGDLHGIAEVSGNPSSFVTHLSVLDKMDFKQAAERLLAVQNKLKEITCGTYQVQLCAQSLWGAEKSLDSRLKAPPGSAPSLRLAVSSEHTPEEVAAISKALRQAFLC